MPQVIVSRLRAEGHRTRLCDTRIPSLFDVPESSAGSHMAECRRSLAGSDTRKSPARVAPGWSVGVPENRVTLSVTETCRLLGISRAWLYTLIRRGELTSVKIGNRRLIRVDSIVELLDRNERAPSETPPTVVQPAGTHGIHGACGDT